MPDTARSAVELSVAVSRLRSRLREEAGTLKLGLSLTQLALLKRLLDHGPATAATLAAAEHVTQQAIAQSLAPLKSRELIQSEPDPGDGRKTLISATPSGVRLANALLQSKEAWLARAIDATVADEERPTLAAAIELLERVAAADLGSNTTNPTGASRDRFPLPHRPEHGRPAGDGLSARHRRAAARPRNATRADERRDRPSS